MNSIIENLSAQIALKISEKFLKLIEENFEILFANKVFDVVKINIQPGDIVILRYPGMLRPTVYERLKDSVQPHFPNNKVMIFEDGLDISVVTKQ